LRWRRVTLAEVRILHFAICHELQIDLWQRPAGPRRLRRLPYDRCDAVHEKAIAGPGTALHKSRLLASCSDFGAGPLAWGRLHGDSRTETDEKRTEDGSPSLISVHIYRSMRWLLLCSRSCYQPAAIAKTCRSKRAYSFLICTRIPSVKISAT